MDDIAQKVLDLPIWKSVPTLEPLKGGVSNASYIVRDGAKRFVARVGEDYPFHQVSRNREAIASRAAHAAGLSPAVIYTSPGLMVVEFIEARTFTEEDVRNNWQACIDLVKRCHHDMAKRITGQGAIFWVFQILRDYAETLKTHQHSRVGEIPRWMGIVDQLEAEQVPLPIVFGHQDLLPTNFMDDGSRLWLIDWEYGAFGTPMFDLANLAAANSFDTSLEQKMLETYFEKTPDLAKARAFSAMKVAAALREAMWGMVSEIHLNAPGVDYVAYAAEYLSRFEAILKSHKDRF
jgi:thiamine kinase-like enzyme